MDDKQSLETQLEKQYNIYAVRTILLISFIYTLIWLANELGMFYVDKIFMRISELVVIALLVPIAVILRLVPFKNIYKIKYVIIAEILVMTLVTLVFLNFHATVFLVFPLLVSLHYRSDKLNIIAAVGTVVIALFSPVLAFWLQTLDYSFIAWFLMIFDPAIIEQFPKINNLVGTLLFEPSIGLLVFYGLPNALILLGFSGLLFNVGRARAKTQDRWAEEVKDISNEKEQALELADVKSQFLSTMSHEIRTPLNAIIGMNTAILREAHEKNIIEYAGDVDSAGKMLLSLINDILDYSKLDAGKASLQLEEYYVDELVSFCEKLVKSRAEDKGLKVVVSLDEKMPSVLYGDVRRIKQIVTNLLTNAVKYTQEGQVRLSFPEPVTTENGINLIIRVADTGEGIREEDIEKLFSPFDRIDQSKHTNIEGTGLGLAITQKLIAMMDGTIDVKSTFGKGSVFTVTIPQEVIDSTPVGVKERESDPVIKPENNDIFVAPNANILVVDDVDLNIKVARALLTATQVRIDDAASGDECIEMLQRKKYDLVLLDHAMPVKDGIQTIREIKELENPLNADTPIIALTANYSADAKNMYLSYGFVDYLAKPFTVEELQRMVAKYLKDKAERR